MTERAKNVNAALLTEQSVRSHELVSDLTVENTAAMFARDMEWNSTEQAIAIAAHEFNNILTTIGAFTELTLLERASDGQGNSHLREVLFAVLRGKTITQRMLSAPRQHEVKVKDELFQLETIVHEVLNLTRGSLPQNIQVTETIEPHTGMVRGCPTQIYQVITNLCRNAEHAMLKYGGTLDIRLEHVDEFVDGSEARARLQPGPYVRLSIRDTGHGIPSDIMDTIFIPFFTTKNPGEGTGLGLHIVQDIVWKHRGILTVDSIEGQGAVFQIFLPLAQEHTDR